MAYIDQLRALSQSQTSSPQAAKPLPVKPQKTRQDSFGGDPTADPWASPSNNQLPPPSAAAHTIAASGGSENSAKNGLNGVARTTSAFTTGGDNTNSGTGSPQETLSASAGAEWSSYNGSSTGFSEQPTLGGGFGQPGDDQPNREPPNAQTSISQSITIPPGTGESVTVTMLPDKEGMFLFQHHNYEVKTVRRGSTVVRRYSDFVWLLDCLQKRYPFRRLPLLPPKRVQGEQFPYRDCLRLIQAYSEWDTSCSRRSSLLRKAKTRPGSFHKCTSPASRFEPGDPSGDVPHRPNSECLPPIVYCLLCESLTHNAI